jgi:hypothetical protein
MWLGVGKRKNGAKEDRMFNENLPNKEGNCPLQNERQG